MKDNNNEQWDKIISSKHKLFDLKLREVWDYRDLILLFVKRDFVIYYKHESQENKSQFGGFLWKIELRHPCRKKRKMSTHLQHPS